MDILQREEFSDPGLAGKSITVTEVRVSPDLKHATAFCAPLGGEGMDAMIAGLNRAAGFLRHKLAGEVELRYTPSLRFISDESFDEARRIDRLLDSPEVRRDTRAPREAGDGDTSGGEG